MYYITESFRIIKSLILLIGTAMVIIYCYKICVFCFENKCVGQLYIAVMVGPFIFISLVFFCIIPLGKESDKQSSTWGHQKQIIQPNTEPFLSRVG